MDITAWTAIAALGLSGLSVWYSRIALDDARAVRREAREREAADAKITAERRLRIEGNRDGDLLIWLTITYLAEDRSRSLDVQLDGVTPGARFFGQDERVTDANDRFFVRLHARTSGDTFVGQCFLLSPKPHGETEIDVTVFASGDPSRAILSSRRAISVHATA